MGYISKVCSSTASSFLTDHSCYGTSAAAISFDVFAALLALAMLVMWLFATELAKKLNIILANVLFLFVAIATITGAFYDYAFHNLANFTAFVTSTLLAVKTWNQAVDASSNKKNESTPATYSQPPTQVEPIV